MLTLKQFLSPELIDSCDLSLVSRERVTYIMQFYTNIHVCWREKGPKSLEGKEGVYADNLFYL